MTSQSIQSISLPTLSTNGDLAIILKIQTEVLKSIHDFCYEKSLVQLMPVILSPITDPLSHSVNEANIDYLGQKLQLTKSMILHKQIAIAKLGVKGIYIMSPNVRLEKDEKYLNSRKHLLEFTQVDIELKDASSKEFRSFMEEMIVKVFSHIKEKCSKELEQLGVSLTIPKEPFRCYASGELKDRFGVDYETEISLIEKEPFWITDFEREFYDREDPVRKGHYINYDLVYPEGFGEALSGGERDYQYDILLNKILKRQQNPKDLGVYMDLAKDGELVPSAGGGLGVERLIRFITKRSYIKDITPFPKIPGTRVYL